MDTQKIREALEDLHSKRVVIDQAISSLEKALSLLSGEAAVPTTTSIHAVRGRRPKSEKSYIDRAADLLSNVEQMHIDEILKQIGSQVGYPVSRGTVDAGISREIRERGNASRFERAAPGVYRLRKPADPLETVA